VITIDEINGKIVKRIDFLLDGQRKDVLNKDLVKGIMNTRSYNTTIVAYRDILNGNYISDTELKLHIARHIAYFEGIALSKRMWSQQWDHTARPYLYDNGLFKSSSKKNNLISDPIFRTVLWDRRMFAHDVEIKTPKLLMGIDSVILRIDELIAVDKKKN